MGLFTSDSEERKQKELDSVLNTPHVTSHELNQYRFGLGKTPLESVKRLTIPTPHQQHKDYSSIETAKRKMESEEKVIRLPHQTVEQLHHCNGPDTFESFQQFRPCMSKFQKPLRLKIPKW